jgi:hypothetical protein
MKIPGIVKLPFQLAFYAVALPVACMMALLDCATEPKKKN